MTTNRTPKAKCTCKHYDRVDGTCEVHPAISQKVIDEEERMSRRDRTSEAFQRLAERYLIHSSGEARIICAAAEKYRRMEEALVLCERFLPAFRQWNESPLEDVHEALAFDPLS